jgi:hypothetical protein
MSKYGNKKITYLGVQYDSKLELYTYQVIKANKYNIKRNLESKTILSKQKYYNVLKRKYEAIRKISYTYDFNLEYNGKLYCIECKGFESRDYSLRKKLYIDRYLDNDAVLFVEIRSQADVIKFIEYLKEM